MRWSWWLAAGRRNRLFLRFGSEILTRQALRDDASGPKLEDLPTPRDSHRPRLASPTAGSAVTGMEPLDDR